MHNTITSEYLRNNPSHIFVFGDNTIRKGKGGAAKLRDEPNTYGFITKKYPNNNDSSFYRPDEYRDVFKDELLKFLNYVDNNYNKLFLVSKLGAGLANKYNIHDVVICPTFFQIDRLYHNICLINNWETY